MELGDSMALRIRLFALLVFAGAVFCGACGKTPGDKGAAGGGAAARPTIVMMTDFGTANDAVAVCKAVIVGIAPEARLMDITHQVTPFQIEEAARFLAGVNLYYPSGTIFLVVVDPGVGTSRKAVIVKTKRGQYFVLPDNGLITPVIERDGLDSAREITNTGWMLEPQVSSTFHGRDIFSPTAAHLAEGWDFTLAGAVVPQLVQLTPRVSSTSENGIAGDIVGLDDPYGSLISDIPGEEFKKLGYLLGDKIIVQLNKKPLSVPYVKTFMDVPVGEALLYIDSRGRIGLALNQRNFSQVNKITTPGTLFIPRKGAAIKK
jgi:S-adenosylmethionine hydrolase